jgi:hypothetical protein
MILRNTFTKVVASSNHGLPEAAARSLALPSQRQPFRSIFGNTPTCKVAAAKGALAVRAAQRRASCSQLKRALAILVHACSAVAQHFRQEGVRGSVLQQR